jgi:hypothetical protein
MTSPSEVHDRQNDRPQTVHDGHRPPDDGLGPPDGRLGPSSTVNRVTVPEAAEILGTTTDAVRSRMRRGKLRREEGEDGTVYVLLDNNVHDAPTTARDGRESGNQTVGDSRETVEDGPLVERMASEIDHLRRQLEEAHAANRENRRIIAALTQRIPELEAPRDERESFETVSEGAEGAEVPTKEERRSWLYRFFFGP